MSYEPPLFALNSVTSRDFEGPLTKLDCCHTKNASTFIVNNRALVMDYLDNKWIKSSHLSFSNNPPLVAITLSPNGEFIALVNVSGDVRLIHLQTDVLLVSFNLKSMSLIADSVTSIHFRDYICHSVKDLIHYELILVAPHKVIRIFDLDLNNHISSATTESWKADQFSARLLSKMSFEIILPISSDTHSAQITAAIPLPTLAPKSGLSRIIMFINSEQYPVISLWHWDPGQNVSKMVRSVKSINSHPIPSFPVSVTTAIASYCGFYLYTLDSNSHVSVWQMPQLVCLCVSNPQYLDLAVLPATRSDQPNVQMICLLTKTHMTIVSAFDLDTPLMSFALNDASKPGSIYKFSRILHRSRANHSGFMHPFHLRPASANGAQLHSDSDPVLPIIIGFKATERKLEMLHLVEKHPQHQLETFLALGEWDAALQLAAQYGMECQRVHEAKLMASISSNVHVSDFVHELIPLLELVNKVSFRIQACLEVSLLKSGDVLLALDCAQTLLKLLPTCSESYKDWQLKISETKIRFSSFHFLRLLYSPNAWHQFRTCDLVTETTQYAACGDLEKVSILFCRHAEIRQLTTSIVQIVQAIPLSVHSADLTAWLRTSVFPLGRVKAKRKIDQWLESRALTAACLPGFGAKDALQLVDLILEPTRVANAKAMPATDMWISQVFGTKPFVEPPAQLVTLRHHLRDIVYLAEEIGMTMTLDEYRLREPKSIAIDILDQAESLELLSAAILTKFGPYIKRHQLDGNDVLKGYCENILLSSIGDCHDLSTSKPSSAAQSTSSAHARFSVTWEARVCITVKHITNDDIKCQVLSSLTSRIKMPWMEEIESMVMELLNRPNTDAPIHLGDLRGQFFRMDLFRMLQGYGIDTRNFDAGNRVHPRQAILLLARHTTPQSISDAVRFAAAFGCMSPVWVLVEFLTHHAKTMAYDAWLAYLEMLKTHRFAGYAMVAARSIAGYLASSLETFDDINKKKLFLKNVLVMCELCIENGDEIEVLEPLRRLNLMYSHLDGLSNVTVSEIKTVSSRLEFYLGKGSGMPVQDTSRLADILNIHKAQAQQLLVTRALDRDDGNEALLLVQEMAQMYCSVSLLMPLMRQFLNYCDKQDKYSISSRLVESLLTLSRQCLLGADSESISEALDIYKSINLFKMVHDQTENGKYCKALGRSSLSNNDRPQPHSVTQLLIQASHESRITDPKRLVPTEMPTSSGTDLNSIDSALPQHYFDKGLVLSPDIMSINVQLMQQVLQLICEMHPRSPSLMYAIDPAHEQDVENPKSCRKRYSVINDIGASMVKSVIHGKLHQVALSLIYMVGSFNVRLFLIGSLDPNTPNQLIDCKIQEQIMRSVAIRAMKASVVDECMVFGYILGLSEIMAQVQLLTSVKDQCGPHLSNIHSLCCIGMSLGHYLPNQIMIDGFRRMAQNVVWWQRFESLSVSYDRKHFPGEPRFQSSGDLVALSAYTNMILLKTNCDLPLALEFANAYQISSDTVYIEFVRQMLAIRKTTENICRANQTPMGSDISAKHLTYKNDVLTAQSMITQQENLLSIYHEALMFSDPFDYDTISFLLSRIESIINTTSPEFQSAHNKHISIYRAISTFEKPSSCTSPDPDIDIAQKNGWNLSFARKRLHYLFLIRDRPTIEPVWDYLKIYLNVSTCDTLKNLANLLAIPNTTFFGHVVQSTVTRNSIEGQTTLYASIKPSIDRMNAPDAVFDVCVRAACNMNGNEKVRILRRAVQASAQISNPTNDVAVDIVIKDLHRTNIEQLILKYQLHEYLDLVDKPDFPTVIIRRVYQDVVNLLDYKSVDIHTFAKEVSQVAGLELRPILDSIFETYLHTEPPTPIDELPSAKFRDLDWGQDQAVLYLLDAFTPAEIIEKFIQILSSASQSIATYSQLRVLNLLHKLPHSISKSIHQGMSLVEQRCMLMALVHIYDHQHLRIDRTLNELVSSSQQVVQSLWVNHSSKSLVPQLICNLCYDYKVKDFDLLDKCLDALISRQHFKYLSCQISSLSIAFPGIPHLVRHWRQYLFQYILLSQNTTQALTNSTSWIWLIADSILQCPIILNVLGPEAEFGFELLGIVANNEDLTAWLVLLASLPIPENSAVSVLVDQKVHVTKALAIVDTWQLGGCCGLVQSSARILLFAYIYHIRAYKLLVGNDWLSMSLRQCIQRNVFYHLVKEATDVEAKYLVQFYFKETGAHPPPDLTCDPVAYFLQTYSINDVSPDYDDEHLTF